MAPAKKAAWIRRIFLLILIGGAAVGGYFFVMPGSGEKKEQEAPDTAVKATKENIDKVQGKAGVLTITNMRLDGNPDSKKLQQILEELKKNKYGEKIQLAKVELELEKEPQLAAAAGVVDFKQFAGHLDFHEEGRKLGELVNQTDPKIVEETIDRFLASMFRRIDKNWLPEVPGMQRDRSQPATPAVPQKKSVVKSP